VFDHWTRFVAFKPGKIFRGMPLVVLRGHEPPSLITSDGGMTYRIAFDPHRRLVAYASPSAQDDIRTIVELVQEVTYADAQAETR
jgi:hypothetical protein